MHKSNIARRLSVPILIAALLFAVQLFVSAGAAQPQSTEIRGTVLNLVAPDYGQVNGIASLVSSVTNNNVGTITARARLTLKTETIVQVTGLASNGAVYNLTCPPPQDECQIEFSSNVPSGAAMIMTTTVRLERNPAEMFQWATLELLSEPSHVVQKWIELYQGATSTEQNVVPQCPSAGNTNATLTCRATFYNYTSQTQRLHVQSFVESAALKDGTMPQYQLSVPHVGTPEPQQCPSWCSWWPTFEIAPGASATLTMTMQTSGLELTNSEIWSIEGEPSEQPWPYFYKLFGDLRHELPPPPTNTPTAIPPTVTPTKTPVPPLRYQFLPAIRRSE